MQPRRSESMAHLSDALVLVGVFCSTDWNFSSFDAADALLQRTWAACGQLGMTEAPLPDLPIELPALSRDEGTVREGFRALAARCRRAVDAGNAEVVDEAFAFQDHDVRGVLVELSVSGGSEPSIWSELEARWQQAWDEAGAQLGHSAIGAGRDALLVEIRVFGGLLDDAQWSAASPGDGARERPGKATLDHLMAAAFDRGRPAMADRVRPGVALVGHWEVARRGYKVMVVAPVSRKQELGLWAYSGATDHLAALPALLLHASKVRHEDRFYRGELVAQLRSKEKEAECCLTALLAVHNQQGRIQAADYDTLVRTHAQLTAILTAGGGLLETLAKLRRVQLAATVAWRNMRVFVPEITRARGASLLAVERAQAEALRGQLAIDMAYAATTVRRARDVGEMTELRLRQLEAERADIQAKATLVQASWLGTLLAGLAAISVLHFVIVLPQILEWSVVVAVAGLASAVPLLVMHRSEWGRLGNYGASVASAVLAWLLVTVACYSAGFLRHSWSLLSLIALPAGASLGWFGAKLVGERRAQASAVDAPARSAAAPSSSASTDRGPAAPSVPHRP